MECSLKYLKMAGNEERYRTHDPAIYQDEVTGKYYIYSTGGMCRESEDLIHFTKEEKVVKGVPEEAKKLTGGDAIWAPDIVKVGAEYRLYCSNSSWGSRNSCIFLAVSDRPEGPFTPRDIVVWTSEELEVNAIDANIITNVLTGQQYLLYGSFWGGCHMLKLDTETGLSAEPGTGVCVARRPKWMDGAIEGPYMVYNKDTGYYYLFVSYGSLKNDYNIRVGRSKNITGPFLDHNGRDMTDVEDEDNAVGYMLACGYHFEDSEGHMGPGHNSVLHNYAGEWFLVCHIRRYNFKKEGPADLQIQRMFWTKDGWPVVLPEPYAGEEKTALTREELVGQYERIRLQPTLPQGVLNAVPMELLEDGRMICCSIQGHWNLQEDNLLTITYGSRTEELYVVPVWDQELKKETLAFTGKDNGGIALWGKKREVE